MRFARALATARPRQPARWAARSQTAVAILRSRPHVWFVLPALVLYLGFFVLPTLGTYWLSLFDWKGVGPLGDFVGVDNFKRIFTDSEFLHAALNNVWIFLVLFVFTNIASLGIAMLLDRRFGLRGIYRAIIFLPYVMSPVAIAFIWETLVSPNIGLVNPALEAIGLGSLRHEWLADPDTTLPVVIVALVWQWNAITTIIFLAGLQNVPSDLIDAARVDGASRWHVIRDVTVPSLAPAFAIVNVLTLIFAFRAFDLIYLIAGPLGGPDGAAMVMGTEIYTNAFGVSVYQAAGEMSYAIAQGVMLFLVLGIATFGLILLFMRRERRVGY